MAYIKMAIVGQAEGQEIVTVLYYAPNVVSPSAALDVAERTTMAADFISNHLANFLSFTADLYVTTELQTSAVNNRNEVVSDYTIFTPVTVGGTRSGTVDGVANVGIIGFQTSYPFTGAEVGMRTPKRSYIALGPLVSTDIFNNGAVAWTSPQREDVESALLAQLAGDAVDWVPVRVGVPNKDDVPAVGRVEGVIFRPYSSDRRSRRRRPNGR